MCCSFKDLTGLERVDVMWQGTMKSARGIISSSLKLCHWYVGWSEPDRKEQRRPGSL